MTDHIVLNVLQYNTNADDLYVNATSTILVRHNYAVINSEPWSIINSAIIIKVYIYSEASDSHITSKVMYATRNMAYYMTLNYCIVNNCSYIPLLLLFESNRSCKRIWKRVLISNKNGCVIFWTNQR